MTAAGSSGESRNDRDRPLAWNIEAATLLRPDVELAVRLEGSRELLDQPRWRAGAALSYRFADNAAMTVEYLRSSFDPALTVSDDGQRLRRGDRVGLRLDISF